MTRKRKLLLLAVLALLLAGPALALVGAYYFVSRMWRSPGRPPLVVTVEATYPGANAQVVADTVAVPIEQQVNGVEGMLYMSSQAGNDGSYTLHVVFPPGVDLNMAQVLVQNRVSLALPMLPDVLKLSGVAVKKKSPRPLLLVTLTSPDASLDALYLGNYATRMIADELARLPGVGEVTPFAQHGDALRIQLDPDLLAARDLTVADVVKAVEEHKAQLPAGHAGPPAAAPAKANLAALQQVENLVIRATDDGRVLRLKDVSRVERGSLRPESFASLDGKPAAVLAVYPTGQADPRKVSADLQDKLAELGGRLPPGIALDVPFDFTSGLPGHKRPTNSSYLLVDIEPPDSTSPERIEDLLKRCAVLLGKAVGVEVVLALSEHPFALPRHRPCLVARLTPAASGAAAREALLASLRRRFAEEVQDAVVHVCDLSRPGAYPPAGYPLDVAVHGPELDRVRELGARLAERLRESPQFTDVGDSARSASVPQVSLDVDREKCLALGVRREDVQAAAQVCSGDFTVLDRPCKVVLSSPAERGDNRERLRRVKVRGDGGTLIPLSSLVRVRDVLGPAVVERVDMWPAVKVTASLSPGVSAREARSLCEGLAEQVRDELGLSPEYRLTWLGERPR